MTVPLHPDWQKFFFIKESFPSFICLAWKNKPESVIFLSCKSPPLSDDIPFFKTSLAPACILPFDFKDFFRLPGIETCIRSPGGLTTISKTVTSYVVHDDSEKKYCVGPLIHEDSLSFESIQLPKSFKTLESLFNYTGLTTEYNSSMTVLLPVELDIEKYQTMDSYSNLVNLLANHLSFAYVFPQVQETTVKSLTDEPIHVKMSNNVNTFNSIPIKSMILNTVDRIIYSIDYPMKMKGEYKMKYSINSLSNMNEYLDNTFNAYVVYQLDQEIEELNNSLKMLSYIRDSVKKDEVSPCKVSELLNYRRQISCLLKQITSKNMFQTGRK